MAAVREATRSVQFLKVVHEVENGGETYLISLALLLATRAHSRAGRRSSTGIAELGRVVGFEDGAGNARGRGAVGEGDGRAALAAIGRASQGVA